MTDKPTLSDHLVDIIPDPQAGGFPVVKLTVKDGPDMRFQGYEAAAYSGDRTRQRFTEVVLWATEDNNFVAGSALHSNAPGEQSFWTARQVVTVEDAMDAWGWTSFAKALARKLGWDVTRYVD